ncbi:protein-tyrosine kinase [Cetacean poxvirus 1]|nr:protein-tyrosine kinase [Cetacean poxvirus 1]
MDNKKLYEHVLLRSTGFIKKPTSPMDVTRISNYVYLGNFQNALDSPKSSVAYKYILNLTTKRYTLECSNATIIHIPLVDDVNVDITKHLDSITDFLNKCEKHKEPVLVHCVAGVNRSGAIIMAYVMTKKNKDNIPTFIYFLHMYYEIKELRGAFLENPSFRKQIIRKYVLSD